MLVRTDESQLPPIRRLQVGRAVRVLGKLGADGVLAISTPEYDRFGFASSEVEAVPAGGSFLREDVRRDH